VLSLLGDELGCIGSREGTAPHQRAGDLALIPTSVTSVLVANQRRRLREYDAARVQVLADEEQASVSPSERSRYLAGAYSIVQDLFHVNNAR